MSQTSLPTSFPPLIDVDCNLWHRDLKSLQINKDQSAATAATWTMLQEDAIQQANIVAMLSPSSTLQEAKQGLQLLQEPPPPLPIRTTVGVHPYHVQDDELQGISWQEHQEAIKDLVQTADNLSLIAAIGECGLDASEGFPPLEEQLPWFAMQIAVAQELQLPLFVHERLAFRECIQLLEEVTVPVIIHCFTGTQEECAEYVKRGYSISVSGYILKDSNDNCSEVLSCLEQGIIPLDKLMIETDAPYMGFDGCRHLYLEHNSEFVASLNSKKRKRLQQSIYPNVPSSLPMVLQKVTECLQKNDASLTLEAVAEATTINAQSFFGLSV
jgi:TatD DNase family protein